MSRFGNRRLLQNDLEEYSEFFRDRDVKQITHFGTGVLRYPSVAQITTLQSIKRVWAVGDRYYKLAHKYYGDSRYWWVIAWFNKKPTDQHLKTGDLVKVPVPLRDALGVYGL